MYHYENNELKHVSCEWIEQHLVKLVEKKNRERIFSF